MYKFTSTNKSPRSLFAGVRVYNEAGDKVVEFELSKHSAINYLRKHNGKHRKAFIAQCLAASVPQNEINDALSV